MSQNHVLRKCNVHTVADTITSARSACVALPGVQSDDRMLHGQRIASLG